MEELGSYPAVTLEEQLGRENQENERDKPQHVAQPWSHVRPNSNFNNRTAHVTMRQSCNVTFSGVYSKTIILRSNKLYKQSFTPTRLQKGTLSLSVLTLKFKVTLKLQFSVLKFA